MLDERVDSFSEPVTEATASFYSVVSIRSVAKEPTGVPFALDEKEKRVGARNEEVIKSSSRSYVAAEQETTYNVSTKRG